MSDYKVKDLKGKPIDYSDKNNWVNIPEKADKEVDTFFVYPTVYINPAPDAPKIVPVEDEMYRTAVQGHFNEAPRLFWI